jgi:hypothetical protein
MDQSNAGEDASSRLGKLLQINILQKLKLKKKTARFQNGQGEKQPHNLNYDYE